MYDDAAYAQQRLGDTFIRYEEKPVFVQNVDRSLYLDIFSYKTQESRRIHINSPEFNFKPIPLGYVNYRKVHGSGSRPESNSTETSRRAYYLQRLPIRRMKQGLQYSAVHCKNRPANRNLLSSLLQLPLYEATVGNYPAYSEVMEEIKANESIAFDIKLAIKKRDYGANLLEYKGTDIGFFETGMKSFAIGETYMYLQELLQYYGVPCHAAK